MDTAIAKKIEDKGEVTEPWSPANILTVSPALKDELEKAGLRGRWKRKTDLDKARLEGWEPFNMNNPQIGAKVKTLIDGTSMGTTIEKRGLIFCVLPLNRVKAREAYFKKLTEGVLPGKVKEFDERMKQHGTRAYGSIKIET